MSDLIGSFNLEIGYVYDQPCHSLISKWLLLTDPENLFAGLKGYLKVSINVIGPGDEMPVFILIIYLLKFESFSLNLLYNIQTFTDSSSLNDDFETYDFIAITVYYYNEALPSFNTGGQYSI